MALVTLLKSSPTRFCQQFYSFHDLNDVTFDVSQPSMLSFADALIPMIKKSNLVTLDMLKCLISSVPVNSVKPLNISLMSVTLAVLKFETSNEVRADPENIALMFVTFSVLKLDTLSEVRDEQPPNIPFMLVTYDVSKLLRSSDVRERHPENIPSMFIACDMSKLLRLSVFKEEQS